MRNALASAWLRVADTLWFVPGLIGLGFAVLALVLVEVDDRVNLRGAPFVFAGGQDAARTVLSVIAGSLITVAGVTFSITVVVLQLASSQFSPRALENFFGDRPTQITVGAFVGIFTYALLVLRSVGTFDEGESVPRLSVTVASALGIVAMAVLVFFIHHIVQMIRASSITARIGHATLEAIDRLYPEQYAEPADVPAADLVAEWSEERGATVGAARPGYVERVSLDDLVEELGHGPEHIHVTVSPGDFVGADDPIAVVWPAASAEHCVGAARRAILVGDERTMLEDAAFGIRQLTDIALRAISPSLNDPTTAYTCIGYIRSALTRLAARSFPSRVRRYPERGITFVVRERTFDEYLEALQEIGRSARGDARIAGALLEALAATAGAAVRADAWGRASTALELARVIAGQAQDEAGSDHDRASIERHLDEVELAARADAAERR